MNGLYLQVEFVKETCIRCGIVFAMTKDWYDRLQLRKEQGTFYCPNGHNMHYRGKSHEQEVANLKLTIQQRDNALAEERKRAERLEKRAQKGVCLYCKRTFGNLAKHMECKHADQKARI